MLRINITGYIRERELTMQPDKEINWFNPKLKIIKNLGQRINTKEKREEAYNHLTNLINWTIFLVQKGKQEWHPLATKKH